MGVRGVGAEEGGGGKDGGEGVLQGVELEQTTGARTERSIDNRNLLLWSYYSYLHGSSYNTWRWAYCRAIDGNEKTSWGIGGNETKGWLDISMGLLKTVDRVVVHEAGNQIRAYELSLYDGKAWRSVARGETLGS